MGTKIMVNALRKWSKSDWAKKIRNANRQHQMKKYKLNPTKRIQSMKPASMDELVKRMSGTAKAKRMRKRDEEIEHRITVMRLQDAFDRVFSKARHNYRNGN